MKPRSDFGKAVVAYIARDSAAFEGYAATFEETGWAGFSELVDKVFGLLVEMRFHGGDAIPDFLDRTARGMDEVTAFDRTLADQLIRYFADGTPLPADADPAAVDQTIAQLLVPLATDLGLTGENIEAVVAAAEAGATLHT